MFLKRSVIPYANLPTYPFKLIIPVAVTWLYLDRFKLATWICVSAWLVFAVVCVWRVLRFLTEDYLDTNALKIAKNECDEKDQIQ